jgi:DNA repair protein RadC
MINHPISMWAEEDRPREKLQTKGKHTLSDSELIAILLRTGSGTKSAVDLARELLSSVDNNLHRLSRLSAEELSKIKGIGMSKATTIQAAFELGNRKAVPENSTRSKITSSKMVFDSLKYLLADLRHEEFWLLLLDRSNKLITKIQLSKGGVSGTVVDPKMVFKFAVDHLASGIILAHNHPSGNLKPSEADIKLTNKIKRSGELLYIAVLDHIIFSGQGYFSFVDEGIM